MDPRIHAYRQDIADVCLAGVLFAPHYARPQRCGVAVNGVMMRATPDAGARAVSQLVRGEDFLSLDVSGGWAWGRSAHDDYVGYVPADVLGATQEASHRIAAVAAPLFAEPDIKAPVCAIWSLGTRLAGRVQGDFVATDGGFLHACHVAPIGERTEDTAGVAERLIGQPYLWGGRGYGGIDCSGLVQVALGFAGIAAPRDSDLQRDALGRPLAPEEALRRGDLIFFPGHVGIMADGLRMVHANANAMAVTVEPLAEVIARLAPAYSEPVLARRRLEPLP